MITFSRHASCSRLHFLLTIVFGELSLSPNVTLSLCCLALSCLSYLLLLRDRDVIYLSNGIQNDFYTVTLLFSSGCCLPSIYTPYNTIMSHHAKNYDTVPLRGYWYSNLSWISKSLHSKLFLSMHMIYKNRASRCVTRSLTELGLRRALWLWAVWRMLCCQQPFFNFLSHSRE